MSIKSVLQRVLKTKIFSPHECFVHIAGLSNSRNINGFESVLQYLSLTEIVTDRAVVCGLCSQFILLM